MKKPATKESRIDEINSRLWKNRYNNPPVTITEATSVLAKAGKADYQKGMAYARLIIAVCNFLQSKNDMAMENLSEALLWFSANSSEPGYSSALNLKGNLYESFGDYEKALQFCLQAHKLATEKHDQETEAETCSQLGMIYTRLCNYSKALEYYQGGLVIREEMNDENAMASSLNRIGMIMRLTKKYSESLDYYFRSLDIRRKNKQITSIPWTLLGMASTYEEMQKTSRALEYYEQGITGGDKRCTLQCMMGSGRIYSLMGKADKAEERLEESLKMAQDLRALSLVAEAHAAFANHYESTGQIEKALKSYKLYQKVRESVQSDEAQSRLRNIEISHAIEKSEQEKEIYRLRHVELKEAYDIIEEKNIDITASINYARRIQQAILPKPSGISGLKENIFILYLPKDIISGDFYWFSRVGKKLVVTAGDCTGHGVPGALMSMLGISFLEEIVNNRRITESGQILNDLRKEVQRALHQKGIRDEAKDGMDLSLCVIDRTKNVLQYSGANNNLYMVRDGELIDYHADRMPIGIYDLVDKDFTSHNIQTMPGDLIYMFSDGYADQFGGPNHKKFKYTTLKALLIEIHKLPLTEQKQILEKQFFDWKGNSEQIDDVLILGLKI
ncbi:MAG: tetratricopeptide repeat protein [Bacteroidia bacterium]|nr:tetratricopeptide repeat protein [Bacteroidia bacterium]